MRILAILDSIASRTSTIAPEITTELIPEQNFRLAYQRFILQVCFPVATAGPHIWDFPH